MFPIQLFYVIYPLDCTSSSSICFRYFRFRFCSTVQYLFDFCFSFLEIESVTMFLFLFYHPSDRIFANNNRNYESVWFAGIFPQYLSQLCFPPCRFGCSLCPARPSNSFVLHGVGTKHRGIRTPLCSAQDIIPPLTFRL
jgi:hypothetical protein